MKAVDPLQVQIESPVEAPWTLTLWPIPLPRIMQVIDPRELNDLAAFASRGGLGHGVA